MWAAAIRRRQDLAAAQTPAMATTAVAAIFTPSPRPQLSA
jgi:hypothetical protein